ncbi:hypothetical protein [Ottowia testudinis]|uniref:Uncharacterized protein n=1 Tax=Ottowia testudinis TaxID=2816950 RepID=A0A975CIL9_9BURK|nr:hypothetical protein [Ottowia testudinis]QTD45776.1 hypothetical protein J1M35_02320 [Ottowia testudinis]
MNPNNRRRFIHRIRWGSQAHPNLPAVGGFVGRAATMVLSMVTASFFLASLRFVLELVSPSYSAFGPTRPFLELILVVLIFSGFLCAIEIVATALHLGYTGYRPRLVSAGAICALGASGSLIDRVAHPVFGCSVPELLVIGAAVLGTFIVRVR